MTAAQRLLDHSIAKIRAVLGEIKHLKQLEFPHAESKLAVEYFETTFLERLAALRTISPNTNPRVAQAACQEVLSTIDQSLPRLGLIRGSTNVRNSFEVHGPLLRLCRDVLGENRSILISSEWEYNAFVFGPLQELPGFVLIGLPASESENALLLPATGHEIGHEVWDAIHPSLKENSVEDEIASTIERAIENRLRADPNEFKRVFNEDIDKAVVVQDVTRDVYPLAIQQAQEVFADFVGIRIFGESFLHALAYLLAPGQPDRYSVKLPPTQKRLEFLTNAAARFRVSVPPDYHNIFASQSTEPKGSAADSQTAYLWRVADSAVESISNDLLAIVEKLLAARLPADWQETTIEKILNSFRLLVPATHAGSLANIVNAGWRAYFDPHFFDRYPVLSEERERILKELMLKSIEILHVEQLQTTSNQP